MITGITKEKHAFTDFTYVPLVLAAPKLVGFIENKPAAKACYLLATSVLAYSLLTDAKWGLVRVIPYETHAALDLLSGVASLTVAATIKSRKNSKATNTLLLMGITGLVVGTLSLIGAEKKLITCNVHRFRSLKQGRLFPNI